MWIFLLFSSVSVAGILSDCNPLSEPKTHHLYMKKIKDLGGDLRNHCLDQEDSLFKFGERVFVPFMNSTATGLYEDLGIGSTYACSETSSDCYSTDCYKVFALKTSNLSRKVDEKIKFNNGKTYTFFAESKKGTWLMWDEAGKCVYYKPSPPTPAKPKADAAPKSKAKDCEKGPNVPGLKPIQSVLKAN